LELWEFARENRLIVVTKDKDFREFSLSMGAPPKLIWIGLGNCSKREIEQVLRKQAVRISEFEQSDKTTLFIGRRLL
jgi:predicted nuclease of predicted toxin-antitoxin system